MGPQASPTMDVTHALQSFHQTQDIPFKIPPFGGGPDEEVERLLSNFDQFCTNKGKDEAYKAKTIPFLLKGAAHSTWRALSDSDKANYQTICEQLRLNFGTIPLPCEVSYPLLSALKMENEGSVQKYYEKFQKLAQNLDVTPAMLQAFFTNGLDRKVRDYVTLRRPQSLAETLKLAKQAELIPDDGAVSSQMKDLHSKLDRFEMILGTTPSRIAMAQPSNANQNFADVTQHNKSHPDFDTKPPTQQSGFANMDLAPPRFTTMGPQCQLCGTTGHVATVCNNIHRQQCQLCLKYGHTAPVCRTDPRINLQPACQLCQATGHTAQNCWKTQLPPQPRQQQSAAPSALPPPPRNQPTTPTCWSCGTPGHLSYQCRRRPMQQRQQQSTPRVNYQDSSARFQQPNFRPDWTPNGQVVDSGYQSFQRRFPAPSVSMASHASEDIPNSPRVFTTNGNLFPGDLYRDSLFVDNGMTIQLTIAGKRCRFLIDTGSSHEAIDVSLISKLDPPPTVLTPKARFLTMVDGSSSEVHGELTTMLNIAGFDYLTRLQVINCPDYDGVLGRVFLEKHQALIDVVTKTLHIQSPDLSQKVPIPLGSGFVPRRPGRNQGQSNDDVKSNTSTSDNQHQHQHGDSDLLGKIDQLLEQKLKQINSNIRVLDEKIEGKVVAVDVNHVNEDGEEPSTSDGTGRSYAKVLGALSSPKHIKEAIREVKNDDKIEESEAEKRSKNVIIHGAEEIGDNPADVKKEDDGYVKDILKILGIRSTPASVTRLGNADDRKRRPIKMVMRSIEDKVKVMNNLNKLKGTQDDLGKISITEDYTTTEREEIRRWVKKAENMSAEDPEKIYKVRGDPKNGMKLIWFARKK